MELFNNQIAKATKLALPLGWWFRGLLFFTNFVAENLFRLRVVCGCRYPDQELIKSSTSAVAVLQWTLNILVWRLKRIIILISALASSTFPSLKLMVMLCIPITGLVGDTDLYQSGHGMIFCECSTFSENTTRREGWWQVSECQYRHQDGWRWPAVLLSPVLRWDSKVCAWCKFISGWWHVLRSRFPENLIYFRVAADFTCPTCNSGELVKNANFAIENFF